MAVAAAVLVTQLVELTAALGPVDRLLDLGDAARRTDTVLVELHGRLAGVDVVLEFLFGIRLLVAVAASRAETNLSRQAVKGFGLLQIGRITRRIDRSGIWDLGDCCFQHGLLICVICAVRGLTNKSDHHRRSGSALSHSLTHPTPETAAPIASHRHA